MSEREQQAQILDVHVAFLRLTGVEPDEAGTLGTRLLLADACEAVAKALRAAQTGWQPIATALKDQQILVYDEGAIVNIQQHLREKGICAAICNNGESFCILEIDHVGYHGNDSLSEASQSAQSAAPSSPAPDGTTRECPRCHQGVATMVCLKHHRADGQWCPDSGRNMDALLADLSAPSEVK